MKISQKFFVLLNIFVLSVFIISCDLDSDSTLNRIKKEGFIRIGYANDIPYAYSTSEGRITGEAPEIARIILSKMGINQMKGVFTEFGSLIPALKAGRFDMIAAGMFVLPKRCQEINFSEPTYAISQAFLVKRGNPKYLHSYEDVSKNKNSILCVMEGAAELGYAKALGIPDSQILKVPDTPTGFSAVKTGRADALALTSLSIQKMIDLANDPAVERALPFKDPVINGKVVKGYGAFGFRKEDEKLMLEFNKHLVNFIGTKEHLETVRQFGFTETPNKISTEELCR